MAAKDERNKQHLYLIRHGQSIAQHTGRNRSSNPLLRDAPISPEGHNQCRNLASNLSFDPELVVVSPLKRALQTACIVFENSSCPIIANPDIAEFDYSKKFQENMGTVVFDLYGDPSLSSMDSFCRIDFALVGEGEWWNIEEIPNERLLRFLQWLSMREENTIAVVCHHNVISRLVNFTLKVPNCSPIVCELDRNSLDLCVLHASEQSRWSGEPFTIHVSHLFERRERKNTHNTNQKRRSSKGHKG